MSVVLMMSVSLDGFMEGPERQLDWQTVDEELHLHFNRWLATAGGFLEGRVTHELMAGFWPTAGADAGAPAVIREFAAIWRDMPKVVYSTTLERAGWNATVVREVRAGDVRALESRASGDLVVGGADLAATFLRLDLVDEMRIYVHPVVLGAGKRLFETSANQRPLRLAGTQRFGSGVVLLHYLAH